MLHAKYQSIPARSSRKEDFEDLSKFSFILNKFESPSTKHVSYQVWLKLAWWFLRRSHLKENFDAGWMIDGWLTDAAPWHMLSWPSARWAENYYSSLYLS